MSADQQPEDLLKMMEQQRLVKDKLALIYPALLKEKQTKVEPRDLAERGLELKVWPLLDQWEANVQLKAYTTRDWMNEIGLDGRRNAYRTPERGRRRFHECSQQELQFDIWEKVKATNADRDGIRSDITNYKLAYGTTPTGPDGQKLPVHIWNDDDEKMFILIEGRVSAPAK